MKKYSRIIALLLAVVLVLPGAGLVTQANTTLATPNVERLSGDTRVETAVAVSKAAYTTAETVILAGYAGGVDALTATPLAAKLNAPVLFTEAGKLNAETKAEIVRLGAKTVHILGGEKVVSKEVFELVDALEGVTAKRIEGKDRYETAAAVATELASTTKHAFVALGTEVKDMFPDALAVGPAAAKLDRPVLLTQAGKLPVATKAALAGIKEVTVVGGNQAITPAVVTALEAMGITVDRIAGSDREGTALEIAKKHFAGSDKAVLANGYKGADALIGGYFAAKHGAPILLVQETKVHADVQAYVAANVNMAYVLGGTTVVADTVAVKVNDLIVGEDLRVVSVNATNLKTITVKFNQGIDEDTVSATTVKALKGTTNVVANRTLLQDGNTLVIELAGVTQSDDVKITINGVKSSNGEKTISEYTSTVTIIDTKLPTLMSATVVNAKKITLQFSEPVNFDTASAQVLANVKINGSSVIAKAVSNAALNTVDLEFPTALPVGTHSLIVSDIADFANFKIEAKTFSIAVISDNSAPVALVAEAVSRSTILVTFDEELNLVGTFKVDGTSATPAKVSGKGNQVKLTGFGNLGISAIVEVTVKYSGQTDAIGNTVSVEKNIKFKVEDDTLLPTATVSLSTKIGSLNNAEFTFSKPMQQSGTVVVKNAKGIAVKTLNTSSISYKANTNETVLALTATQLGLTGVDPEAYTFTLEGFKDNSIRENEMPKTTFTVNTVDTKAPTVSQYYLLKENTADHTKDEVTIAFSEAMNEDNLINLSNYIVSNTSSYSTAKVLSAVAGASVKSVSADKKSVTLVVPQAYEANTVFEVVAAIRDLAGNTVTGTLTGLAVAKTGAGEGQEMVLTSVTAINSNTIEIVSATGFKTIDPSSFSLVLSSDDSPAFTIANAVINGSDNTKATLTVNGTLSKNTEIYDLITSSVVAQRELTTNLYNGKLSVTDENVIDQIRPILVSVNAGNTIDGNSVVEANMFTLTFSETVTAGTTDFGNLLNALLINASSAAGPTQLVKGTHYTVTLGKLGTDAAAANTYKGEKFVVELTAAGIGVINSKVISVSVLQNGLVDTASTPNAVVASGFIEVTLAE